LDYTNHEEFICCILEDFDTNIVGIIMELYSIHEIDLINQPIIDEEKLINFKLIQHV
jgi:hypothetical protein